MNKHSANNHKLRKQDFTKFSDVLETNLTEYLQKPQRCWNSNTLIEMVEETFIATNPKKPLINKIRMKLEETSSKGYNSVIQYLYNYILQSKDLGTV